VYLSGISGFFGGFNAPSIISGFTCNVLTSTSWPANQAAAYAFYVGEPITITKISINVSTLSAGSTASAGIYSTSGTKLVDSGVFNCASIGLKTNTISSVTLQQGWYYFVWTNSSASTGFSYFADYSQTTLASLMNANGTRFATGTATSGGVLNSTLGTLTPTSTGFAVSVICVWFE
jgi:hypothetical protein